jgi:HlyD family secretion protein
MLEKKRNIFRKESLERLSSPERLDQLTQVVNPISWLPIFILSVLAGATIIWGFYGRIPITIEGKGVFIYPRKVVPLQTNSSGRLVELKAQVGDRIKKGDVLGIIDQSIVKNQLQQERIKLAELMVQDQVAKELQGEGINLAKETIQQQRQNALRRIQELQTLAPILRHKSQESIQKQRLQIAQRIKELESLTPLIKQRNRESLEEQRRSMERRIRLIQSQLPLLKKRVDSRRPLLQERIISEDIFVQTEQEYFTKLEEIADLQTQLKGLTVKETDTEEKYINVLNEIATRRAELQKLEVEEASAEEAYLKNQSEIAKLTADLKDLDNQETRLKRQNLQDSTTRFREIQEVRRTIAKLDQELQKNSLIISRSDGIILEVTVAQGQVLSTGTRFATVDEENSNTKLMGVTYFSVADGKKIQPGMTIKITPQTVKRERYGGVIGKVNNISGFPITKEGAASVVGNSEFVESLLSKNKEPFKV